MRRSVLASSAVLDESPVAPAQPRAVVSQLVGKKVVQLRPECSAVPLLHPITHNLPFAASLHIYSDSSSQGGASPGASSTVALSSSHHGPSGSLVELHYVISGKARAGQAGLGVVTPTHTNVSCALHVYAMHPRPTKCTIGCLACSAAA